MMSSKIFIASSGRTLEIAKQLRAQLNQDYCDADIWSEISSNQAGKSIWEMLKDATTTYDFAVVVLSKDDLMVSEGREGQKLKARDNCIFEAGLFMGTLGENRCVLLSAIPARDLPTDLQGIIYLPFQEPDRDSLDDPEKCRKAILSLATTLESLIRTRGPITDRPLSREQLLERARRNYEGGELLMDQVVVASVQPMDIDYEPAKRVRKNIDDGNIRYVYFFQGNSDGVDKTCQLLQMVLLANILTSQEEAEDWRGRLEKIEENNDSILAELERICREERLKVFFLPSPPALQYCIHNAASDKNAKLYLKQPDDRFVEWASGVDAYQFWEETRAEQNVDDPKAAKAVFFGVPRFSLDDINFRSIIERRMEIYFPKIARDVIDLCLLGPRKEQ